MIGLTGTSYAVQMTHARPLLPPHVMGRGVTFMNAIFVAGFGAKRFGLRRVHGRPAGRRAPDQVFAPIFLFCPISFLTPEAPDA